MILIGLAAIMDIFNRYLGIYHENNGSLYADKCAQTVGIGWNDDNIGRRRENQQICYNVTSGFDAHSLNPVTTHCTGWGRVLETR